MKNHLAMLIAFALLAPTLATLADDWPVYRHDNRRSAVSLEKLPAAHLAPLWTRAEAAAPQPAWSGPAKWDSYAGVVGMHSMRNYDPVYHPIAVGNRVYFGSSADGTIRALDARTGDQLWVYVTDAPVRIAPAYHEGRLYFGSDDGYAYCLAADTGKLIWRKSPIPGAARIPNNGKLISPYPVRTGVLVHAGRAYFGAALMPWEDAYLCAVDAATGTTDGEELFVKKMSKVTLEGAMLASPTKLYVPQGRSAPLVFNRRDGSPLGALSGGGGVFALLTPDLQFAHGPGNKTGWITMSNAETKDKIASFDGGLEMIVVGNTAIVLKETAIAAFNRDTRAVKWAVPCENAVAMVMDQAAVYVGGKDYISAYNAENGQRQWTHQVKGRAHGIAIAQGRLLASTDRGILHAFAAQPIP